MAFAFNFKKVPIGKGVRDLFSGMRKPRIEENPVLKVVPPVDMTNVPAKQPITFEKKSADSRIIREKPTTSPTISDIQKRETTITTRVKDLSTEVTQLREVRENLFGQKRMVETGKKKHRNIVRGTVNTPEREEFDEMQEIMNFFKVLELERSLINFLIGQK